MASARLRVDKADGGTATPVLPGHRWEAIFFTKLATRVVVPALTELDALLRPPKSTPRPVRDAWRAYERTLDALVRKRLAA